MEQHQLTAAVFDAVQTLLTEQRLLLKAGAMPIMRLMPVSVIGIVVGLGLGRVASLPMPLPVDAAAPCGLTVITLGESTPCPAETWRPLSSVARVSN